MNNWRESKSVTALIMLSAAATARDMGDSVGAEIWLDACRRNARAAGKRRPGAGK